MSFTQVGSCPRCGAPIYVPMMWHAVVPPPNQYTCSCFPQTVVYTTNTLTVPTPIPPSVKKSRKKVEDAFKKTVDELGDAIESADLDNTKEASEIDKLRKELEETKKLLAKLSEKLGVTSEEESPAPLKREILKG